MAAYWVIGTLYGDVKVISGPLGMCPGDGRWSAALKRELQNLWPQ